MIKKLSKYTLALRFNIHEWYHFGKHVSSANDDNYYNIIFHVGHLVIDFTWMKDEE